MLQTVGADGRYRLPDVEPPRITVHPRDLIAHRRHQSLGWITPDGQTVEWVAGNRAGDTDTVDDVGIDVAVENGLVDVIAADIRDPDAAWWLFEDSAPAAAVQTAGLSVSRERSRNAVNAFLEHPVVDHDLGGVVGWKAAFGARHQGDLVAVCVLSRPSARGADDGVTLELNRYAAHPNRPPNTATWLIARAADWARLEGYDQLLTYAGVSNDNEGTIYQASNFERDGVSSADGSGWSTREGRESRDDYTRRRYVRRLHDDPAGSHRLSADDGATSLAAFATGGRGDRMLARGDGRDGVVSDFFETHGETPLSQSAAADAAVFAAKTAAGPDALLAVTNDSDSARDRTHARLSRLAIADHVTYPANTGARLIAAARQWARLEGYHTLRPPATPTDAERASCKQADLTTPASLQE
jgi:GNAT superfamily N-acetyltransferase